MEYLAACHVHSEWSYDGRMPLNALSDKFSRRGTRILLMTEHDRGFTPDRYDAYRQACADASSDAILVVPGIEYSDKADRVHVLVWGVPFLGEGLATGEMLEKVRAANGVAVLAHPTRKDVWKIFDPNWVDYLLGVEVWSRKYDGWSPSKTAFSLPQSAKTVPFVGLDYHTDRQLFPLAIALNLSGAVTEEEVLKCLRSHRFSARAFGVPLGHKLLHMTMPALKIVEPVRRKAASIVRRYMR